MHGFRLLTLSLAAPLRYRPAALPADAPWISGILAGAVPGGEGCEIVRFFDPDALVGFDPDDGPRARAVFGEPFFTGEPSPDGESPDGGTIGAGLHAFMQWRPVSEQALREGVEYFARESWWERMTIAGPWILRQVLEDGKVATQLLGRLG